MRGPFPFGLAEAGVRLEEGNRIAQVAQQGCKAAS